jgi:hypothetical protein
MRPALPLLLLLTFLLAACTTGGVRTRCAADTDCPANFACDAATGTCGCRSDVACEANAFCNLAGQCQARVGCETSLDCPADQFCDRTTGQCLDRDRCTNDVQCGLGSICDGVRFTCVPGCRDTGDCALGQVCRCDGGEASCAVGSCEGHRCDDDSFCRYGERCVPGEDGDKHCAKDDRGPFCQGCQLQVGDFSRCPGEEPNFCLLDRKVSYFRTYCGVDCSAGQECPWGFECRNILILTRGLCTVDTECPANGPACETDADCPAGRCDAATKRCAGKCSYNEDSKKGFCTCSADSECPQDSCDVTSRRCRLTRRPCSLDGDECAHAIYCVNLGNRAACLIGKNCTPSEGITCEDVNEPAPTP